MTSSYSVRIQGAQGILQTQELHAGAGPNILSVAGHPESLRIELIDMRTQRAPQVVKTRRAGKDLWVTIEADAQGQTQLQLKDYYERSGHVLQGLAEDNQYYDYVPTSGDTNGITARLSDGASAEQALGELIYGVYGQNTANAAVLMDQTAAVTAVDATAAGLGLGGSAAAVGSGGLFAGWGIASYLGLAALGAAGIYAVTRNNKDDNNTQTTHNTTNGTQGPGANTGNGGPTTNVNDSGGTGGGGGGGGGGSSGTDKTPPAITITNLNNGKTVNGTSEAGSTIHIYDANGKLIGQGITKADGTYSINLSNAQPHTSQISATSTDAAGNTSSKVFSSVDAYTSAVFLALTSDTGISASDKLSYLADIVATGKDSDATVSYSVNGGSYGDYVKPTVDGVYTVIAKTQDTMGNTNLSTPLVFTLDTTTTKPNLALAIDSSNPSMAGTDNDRFSNSAALNIANVEKDATVTYQINGGAFGSYLTPSMDGVYTVVARSVDAAGNTSDSDAIVFTRDATAPVFSSGATVSVAENISTSTVVYDAQAQDAGAVADSNLTYALSGADAGLFNIDMKTGQVTFKNSPDYEKPLDVGANNVYNIDISAMDKAGNSSVRNVAVSVTNVVEKGDAVVDLGPQGKLIAPVNVDGKWYYHWDRNGNGVADAGDTITHRNYNDSSNAIPTLDNIFTKKFDGAQLLDRSDGLDYTTNETRFAEINGIKLALPTAFGTTDTTDPNPSSRTNEFLDGTAIGSTTLDAGDISLNSKYGDYAAIWDAYNGTGVFTGGPDVFPQPNGNPPKWANTNGSLDRYWTATQNRESTDMETMDDTHAGASHYYMQFSRGFVNSWWQEPGLQGQRDSYQYYAALEMI